MEVILLEDVKALGKKGEVVKVSDGYAKNFILKKKLGVEAKSEKMGAKDIIKINELIDINLDVLCYIDKNITVNVIKNGKSVEKKTLSLPKTLTNVIKCSNPRCICNNEDIDHIFTLTDDIGTYRCLYCETKAK